MRGWRLAKQTWLLIRKQMQDVTKQEAMKCLQQQTPADECVSSTHLLQGCTEGLELVGCVIQEEQACQGGVEGGPARCKHRDKRTIIRKKGPQD